MRYTAASTTTPHSTAGARLASHRAWRWRASNCHRHPAAPALADKCGWGGPPPTACALFPETGCAVGREVMGLLVCCRTAYREAVQVLYAENTFHVSTGAVVLYTDRLLPAERAGAVERLVYRVTEDTAWHYAAEHLGLVPGLPAYAAMMVRVPGAFPGLRRLLVVVQGLLAVRGLLERGARFGGREPPDRDAIRACMLSSMDAVVRSFGMRRALDECVLALGYAAFDHVMEEEREKAEREEVREGMWVQFWRPVTVVRAGGDKVETGYWVRRVAPEETSGLALDFEAVALALPP